jgi:hypothetical protein
MDQVLNERKIDPYFHDAVNTIFKHPEKTAFVMDGPIGIGKSLANSELALTPSGYELMGHLRVGDEVIGSNGQPTKVLGVYPQGKLQTYTVTFADDTRVVCSADHLWSVKKYDSKIFKTVTTQQIIDSGVYLNKKRVRKDGTPERQNLYGVPVFNSPAIFDVVPEDSALPLDPYFLGLLLGDGGFTNNCISFTNKHDHIIKTFEELLPEGCVLRKHFARGAWQCRVSGESRCINPLNKIMRRLGLWGLYSHQKFIPPLYKHSSVNARKKLIQGMLDTDGYKLKSGGWEYTTSSEKLIEDYRFVSSSLGVQLGKTSTKIPTYTYKGEIRKGKKSYRITSITRPITDKKIVSIKPFAIQPCTCIKVDAEDSLFVTRGFNLTHNTTNFLIRAAYEIAQHVSPTTKRGRLVRESTWAAVRESENSAVATFWQILENSIFTPEILAMDDSPVRQHGSHPTMIEIKHDLPDETQLLMTIECHGFNNEKAANRLRTREYLGGMIPEMQGVPYHIFETLVERCGRWRTEKLTIEKEIDGEKHVLSGVTGLAVVLCDVNIPRRDHKLYDNYYDVADKSKLPTMFLTPPPPILPVPIEKANPQVLDTYPQTVYENKEVVWVPNPKVYNMTRHYEEKTRDGANVPWSGYKYWFKRLHNTDSHIRRYILGKPDTIGGEAAVYTSFDKNEHTVRTRKIALTDTVWVGFDPGGYAALEILAEKPGNELHFAKEFYVEPKDRVSTEKLFTHFLFPWCDKHLAGHVITIVPDPASTFLGKNVSMGMTESHLTIMKRAITKENKKSGAVVTYKIQPCRVQNQDTESRINSLGYYLDQQKVTVDPDECPMFLGGLVGGYQHVTLSSGTISDKIDKDNPYSHPVEAGQYPVVNILQALKKAKKNGSNQNRSGIRKAKRTRR